MKDHAVNAFAFLFLRIVGHAVGRAFSHVS